MAKRPNFPINVPGDLELSCTPPFGSELRTPNLVSEIPTPDLDRLARTGLRLTDLHTAPTCSPARAMLLSGTEDHIAGLGAMREQTPATPAPLHTDRRGYERYPDLDMAALPEVLADVGYFAAMSGKRQLVMDVMPTILDFARVLHHGPRFRGRDVVMIR